MIADAIGLRYPLNRIHAFGVVLNFTLPNHEKTNVYIRDNWLYNLEVQSESPTPPDSPQPYENQNANLPDAASHVSGAHHIDPSIDFDTAIHALQYEVDFLRGGLTSLRVDLLGFMDIANE
ncbi:hypothetical protein KIW84_030842 [Lathyrus oleraceus]|uniref:Uncharacterized protein n=1 Tax=Pisum sativum TaxID=3888 RepID=A0A9D5B026_PEA|nr:hypothetical protein KIW84_030842 [Pisum sativum]